MKRAVFSLAGWMMRVALGTGGRLRRSVAMVGGEYARDDSGVVRYGEEREREFQAILKSSSQDTIDSSFNLCKNFLDRK
jgi:hypothetical protein